MYRYHQAEVQFTKSNKGPHPGAHSSTQQTHHYIPIIFSFKKKINVQLCLDKFPVFRLKTTITALKDPLFELGERLVADHDHLILQGRKEFLRNRNEFAFKLL